VCESRTSGFALPPAPTPLPARECSTAGSPCLIARRQHTRICKWACREDRARVAAPSPADSCSSVSTSVTLFRNARFAITDPEKRIHVKSAQKSVNIGSYFGTPCTLYAFESRGFGGAPTFARTGRSRAHVAKVSLRPTSPTKASRKIRHATLLSCSTHKCDGTSGMRNALFDGAAQDLRVSS